MWNTTPGYLAIPNPLVPAKRALLSRLAPSLFPAALAAALLGVGAPEASGQTTRLLGLDISDWQGSISQTVWNNLRTNDNRQFVILRASRGGTTGTYDENTKVGTLSERYDDLYYIQNINRATAGGMFAGSYHFSRPDITSNTGTDEADHFIQMAGPWMRPGYLPPMHDLEAGIDLRTDDQMAQFCIDFANRIYEVMGLRPGIYINGNYAANVLQTASASLRDQLAKPPPNLPTNTSPSVVSPCYPYLWSARWPNQTDPNSIDVQNTEPKDTYTAIYGPWDDYGVTHPWKFWQYASTMHLASYSTTANLDVDVTHGGIEFLKDQLIPAVWLNDSSGDWSTLANWNSGQTPTMPPGGSGTLPTPRLPGAAGSGTTSGQHDTVILERPNANITVTLSTGTHNIRKLYMREALNITGGSLTINYVPSADSTTFGAQFSGPVTLSGSGSLSVHTLQVDAGQIFTLAGGTLTFNTINLMPHSTTPGKLFLSGDTSFSPLSNATATLANGSGTGSSGFVDLNAGTRAFSVGNGTAEADLSVDVPVSNGALSKTGLGTLRLTAANTYTGGTTVSAGRLLVNNTSGSGTGSGAVSVNGGTLGGTGTIAGVVAVNSGGTLAPGTVSAIGTLTVNSVPAFGGTNFMRIDRNGGTPLADKLVLSSGTLNYGGRLVVTNVGAALIGGEVFTLYTASGYTGAFGAVDLPTLDTGLGWDLSDLAANGTIKVVATTAPIITSGPNSLTLAAGQNATFSVNAAGALPLSYQWRYNGTAVSGATLSSYTKTSVQPSDVGSYSVVVTNTYGGVTSPVATLTVVVPPTITNQPLSQTITQGLSATFSVAASGTSPFSYQWRFNAANIAGATASSYARSNVQPSDAGSYSVVLSNFAGTATSANAVLTVVVPPTPPAITTQPQGQTVVWGGTASFNVAATGTAPLAYQWRLNGADIGGATGTTYVRANVQAGDAGDYSVLVTNAYGSVLSSNATLIVDTNVTLPVITAQPQSQTVIAGQGATFTVTATNKASLSYQWRFNAAPIAGATGTAYTLANAQTANAGSYSVVITNVVGSTSSADAVLTVNFSLTATAAAGGSVGKSPDQTSYSPNAVVNLTATPNSGFAFTGWSGDAGGTNNPLAVTMTTNKTISATFVSVETDIILDNTNAAVTFSGAWQTGTSSTDKYGPDYRFASTAVGGLSNATYRPYIYAPGYYDVYIWYPQGINRATNAPWSVVYDGGSLTVPVNQQAGGGGWVLIGSALPFAQGTNGYVSLSNDTGSSGAVVLADAVRFTYVGAISTNLTLAATTSGGGAIYKYPDQTEYAPGTTVNLIAAPAVGWNFNGWSGGASGTANPLALTLTHNLSVTGNFTSTVSDLIVDDSAAVTTGSWTSRTATDDYGTGYRRANTTTGSATATATFTPTIVTAGRYDVYVWYATVSSASAAAPFLVSYNGGTLNLNVNQTTGTGAWRLIASALPFAVGTSGYVVLSNNSGESGLRVVADAVRWVYSANQDSAPVIIAQPQSQTADTGSAATFTASAAGTAPLGYQWRFNGANIGGATTSAYTRSNLQPSDAGTYSLVVSNAVGSVTSSNAVLTVNSVNAAPTISQQPQHQNVNQGGNATFAVAATGTPAPGYQWRFNGADVGGATASSYTRSNVQPTDAGSYSVVVSNIAGTVTSSNALLTVNVPPAITTQPQNLNVNQNSNAVFSVVATGTPAPDYQWRFNGANIGGATASAYTRSNVQPTDAGSYSVVVSNIAGTLTSANALLTVYVPPAITAHPYPQDLKVNQGSNATFTVVATGTPAPGYQWQFNGADISGATASTYTRNNVQPADAGSYSVVASNIAGIVISSNALLTVYVPAAITAHPFPQDLRINQGSNATFTVVAAGTPAPSYQWRFNGADIGDAIASIYTRSDVQPADAGSYSVVVSNIAGIATSADAVLTVYVAPAITTQPQDQTVNQGNNAVFSVVATGSPAPSYQWRFNGAEIGGATDSSYTRSNAQSADAGTYSVVVSNIAGTATSADAVLTVTQPTPPQILGISQTLNGQIELEVSATPGHYAIDSASNLVDWAELANITNTGATFQYTDSETSPNRRFYRVRLVP